MTKIFRNIGKIQHSVEPEIIANILGAETTGIKIATKQNPISLSATRKKAFKELQKTEIFVPNVISLEPEPKYQLASSLKIPVFYITKKHCRFEIKKNEDITTTEDDKKIIIDSLPIRSVAYLFHYTTAHTKMVEIDAIIENLFVVSENDRRRWWKRHVKTEQESKKMYEKLLYVLGEYDMDNEKKERLALFFWNSLNENLMNLEFMKSKGYSKIVDYRKNVIFPHQSYSKILFVVSIVE